MSEYTWGLDLSGTIHGAGGIGGLLACEEPQAEGDPKRYWFFYDANGNVGQVLDATNTSSITIAAKYEYDAYGNLKSSSGPYYWVNPFRFSTKWFDDETGLYYYGYRYYSPRLGRWISRDPIGELGGLSPFAFVKNEPADLVDHLGLIIVAPVWGTCCESAKPKACGWCYFLGSTPPGEGCRCGLPKVHSS